MEKTVAVETTAEAYIELLAARGVDYFFGNGGTDFGPIVDAYAKRLSMELPVPTPVTVPHEITAVAMAHGYTMITGKPQVVMVHTIAGTANSIGGLINASRTGIPMFFSAGRTPLTEGEARGARNGGIHWAQESFDQGGMVREWTKWDYELRQGVDLEGVVDRALALSQSTPQGPVYLTLPREVLAEERESFTYSERPRMQPPETIASEEAVREAAAALAGAKKPIALTRSLGKHQTAVAPFVRLAEALGMPVFDSGAGHMNFPHNNALHQPGDAGAHLAEADVILVTESDVPWLPDRREPSKAATIIALGADPLFGRYPLRSFASDISLGGAPALTLEALADAVVGAKLNKSTLDERRELWKGEHDKARAAIAARAEEGRTKKPLQKAWVARCIEQVRTPDTIIVNELGVDTAQFELTQPGSFFGVSTAGVLGWGMGASLGAKLASPDRTVIACIGDGSYMFGVPSAAHWVSRRMNLPVLYIVWNNAQWSAVANATRGVFPDGWAVKTDEFPFSQLSPSLDFELICQSAGGYAERVEDPDQVPGAIERALKVVQQEKRQALLNIIAN